ncbi:MAG: C40 family peptidase [Lachnospiraceae bacterium]|nr:C40 family peptidase [Lachnospiraceae bacterium]
MAETFKKESRDFKSSQAGFTLGAPVVPGTPGNLKKVSANLAESNRSAGTQSDSRLEHHTRGGRDKVNIAEDMAMDGNFIRYVKDTKSGPVDKMSERVAHTVIGDGATFSFKYSENGDLKANVKLDKGLSRTSSLSGFGKTKNAASFVGEKTKNVSEIIKSSGEEEYDAAFETKAQTVFSQYRTKLGAKRSRFHSIKIDANKEIKQLKKEIKLEEKHDQERVRDAYFNKTRGSFSSDDDKFSKFSDSKFGKNERSSDRFEPDVPSKGRNAEGRSVKFEDDVPETRTGAADDFKGINKQKVQNREMTKADLLDQKKAEKKAAKKQENKQVRRAAAAASVSKMLEAKKNLSSELMSGDRELTGDLLADGNSGLTRTITTTVLGALKAGGMALAREVGKVVIKIIMGILGAIWPWVLAFSVALTMVGFLFQVIGSLVGGGGGDAGTASYDLSVGTSGLYYGTAYEEDEIDEMINVLYNLYPDMTYNHERVMRMALSAVGGAYNQASHSVHTDNVWDCSELAYCAYMAAGIDISMNGSYAACYECQALENAGYQLVDPVNFRPGDIIFWGGATDADHSWRYKQIYHVAIYLGKINGVDRMVEAYGTDRGVIVSDVRTNRIVSICRVL